MQSVTIINHFAIKSPYGVLVDAGHQAERNNLFTVVVLGEVFSAIIWSSTEGGFDITDLFTIFGAIIALCFQFLYFTVDQENVCILKCEEA